MRILVTGSRDWRNSWAVWSVLDHYAEHQRGDLAQVTVVTGDCPNGADQDAKSWALIPGEKYLDKTLVYEGHPAAWDELGKRAGMVRNKFMVDMGADLCLAFIRNYSVGATNCANLAGAAGIPVRIFREDADGNYLGEDK